MLSHSHIWRSRSIRTGIYFLEAMSRVPCPSKIDLARLKNTLLSAAEWHLSTAAHWTRVAKMLKKEQLVEYGNEQERNNNEKKATWTTMMMMMVKSGRWDNISSFNLMFQIRIIRKKYEIMLWKFIGALPPAPRAKWCSSIAQTQRMLGDFV